MEGSEKALRRLSRVKRDIRGKPKGKQRVSGLPLPLFAVVG